MATSTPVVLFKNILDNRVFVFDFTSYPEIQAGDHIVSATITSDTVGLTIGPAIPSGGVVNVRISGGLAGVTYTLTCEALTAVGSTITGCGALSVTACG